MYSRLCTVLLVSDKVFLNSTYSFSISMTSHPAPSLCGLARDKAELFRERYTILQQVWELCFMAQFPHWGTDSPFCCCFYYVQFVCCIYTEIFFVAYTSAWALHPACNRSCCWRGSKQISGIDHYFKYFFIKNYKYTCSFSTWDTARI